MKIVQYLGWGLLFIVFAYLTICIILYLIQEKFIFYPNRLPQDYTFSHFEDFEEKWFSAKDGGRTHALHFHTPNPKGIVLYLHGNARALDDWGHSANDFIKRDYEVIMPDYRSYGKSTGKLSEKAINKDVMMIYQFLLKNWEEKDIIIYGRSLGTGPACSLAKKTNARVLILETPYTSLTAMARLVLPYFPINGLLQYRFNNIKKIAKIKSPVHIFHGTADELIPYRHAQRLAKKRKQPNVLTTIEGGLHNNLPEFEQYQRKLDELLQ